MSHPGTTGRMRGLARRMLRTAGFTLALVTPAGLAHGMPQESSGAQAPAPPAPSVTQPAPSPPMPSAPAGAPGTAVVAPGPTEPAVPAIEPDVQIVRFQGPGALAVEVLSPAPTPVPVGDGKGILTTGLRRGVGYRLRLSNILNRPEAELFPVVEIVGHLHRPENIDPGKFPIRIVFNDDDLNDVLDHRRLVTKVIYLEDPDQAMAFRMAKDEVFALTVTPAESPLKVATALGRPMAIVRIGARKPSIEEVNAGGAGDLGLDWAASIGNAPCPFTLPTGAHCSLPCGPSCAPLPQPRPGPPRDEYLCDGGDRGTRAAPTLSGRISGVEPRDAVVRFDITLRDQIVTRILPTNVVCIYAPRFAEVRTSAGANENVDIRSPLVDVTTQKHERTESEATPKRLVQKQAPELARNRARAAGYKARTELDETSGNRGPAEYDNAAHVAIDEQRQRPELARSRQSPVQIKEKRRAIGIKTLEGPVMTGIVEGRSQAISVWGPHVMTGLETPPNRPGLAVVKLVNPAEAEPGDTLTYVIMYRNMGNSPIRSLVIVDSLLPRLEYLPGTSKGPEGTVFTTAVNRAGTTELHWELPGSLAPGVAGHVSFQAVVR
jgi:uncharacterized repeat protein (TIGR01451 family)